MSFIAAVTRHALSHQWPHRRRDASRWCQTVWIIRLDRRVPLVRPALLAGDVEAAVDVADLQHLVLADDLRVFPGA